MKHKLKRIAHAILPFFRKETYTKENAIRLVKRHKKQIFYGFLITLLIIVLIPPLTFLYFARDLGDKERLMNRNKTGLTLLDQDGQEFFSFDKPKEITYVPLAEIPVTMQQAVVAAEDRDFYTNPGVSLRGIIRAFFANIFAGKIVQGGSTITQELVKNVLLSSSRNYLRKYQEVVLAYEINRRYSKEEILEMYLNSVYFGEGSFGVENAAQTYFRTSAKNLTTAQATLLTALLPAPSALSPLSHDENKVIRRQHLVLDAMVEEKYITAEQAKTIKEEELVFTPPTAEEQKTFAIHFAIYVKEYLAEKFGDERIIRDGFKVRTTLNSQWQDYAERTVRNQVLRLQGNKATNGAAVAIDPKTGAIKAMVGSYDWHDEQFGTANMSVTPRQPGSSFKPIIYADALEDKLITPATILYDDKKTFWGNYTPRNYDKRYRGAVTVRRSLANSLNVPAVEVMDMTGIPSGLAKAQQLGISTLGNDTSKYGLSLVLGTGEVKLLELTNAYAVFADKGIYHEPIPILEIKDKYDKTIKVKTPQPKQVLNDGVAFLISSILSDNNARAEIFGSALTIGRPAAVKTGTTEDYRDALTVGYTPSLVIGVWVGNNDNTPMDNIAGSLGAAPIWRSLMNTFLAGTTSEIFLKPFSVAEKTVCVDMNPRGNAPRLSSYKEFFLRGTEPTDDCSTPSPSPRPSATQAPTSAPTEEPTPTEEPIPTEQLEPTDDDFVPTDIIPSLPL